MSVAALEAAVLERVLTAGGASPKRFFTAVRETVDDAWKLATDADRALPELGLQTSLVDRMCNRYLGRFVAAAEQEQVLARVFYDVTGMLVSPSRLLAPSLVPRIPRVLRV